MPRLPTRVRPDGSLCCSGCKQAFPVTEFNKNRSTPCGYHAYCRSCDAARRRDRPPPKYPRAKLPRTDAVREMGRVTMQRWRERHLDHYRSYQKSYHKRYQPGYRARRRAAAQSLAAVPPGPEAK